MNQILFENCPTFSNEEKFGFDQLCRPQLHPQVVFTGTFAAIFFERAQELNSQGSE